MSIKNLEKELARLKKISKKQIQRREEKKKIRELKQKIFFEKHRSKFAVAEAIGKGAVAVGKGLHKAAVKIEEGKLDPRKKTKGMNFGMAKPSKEFW